MDRSTLTYLLTKLAMDGMPGGMGDCMSVSDLAGEHEEDPVEIKKQVKKGIGVEMEHTDDPCMASEISKDHVAEIPNYYELLGEMEEEGKYAAEYGLGEPSDSDKEIILKFIASQNNLDDDSIHKLFLSLGVDPHEGEEIIYSALQDRLKDHGINPLNVEEKETDKEDDKEEEDDVNKGEKDTSVVKSAALTNKLKRGYYV